MAEVAARPSAAFRRSQRIQKRRDFLRIQEGGARASAGPMLLLGELRGDDAPARLGVVASRKVGNAVMRNRAKRLVREALRQNASWALAGLELLVIVRPGLEKLGAAEVARELLAGLPRLLRRLRTPGGSTRLP
ncbi:MAG: ribonuclease P protein component [Polyangiaceae bacterium]